MEKFHELKYVRPSIDETKQAMEDTLQAFISANTFDEAEEAFLKRQDIMREFGTMASLAHIRGDMNRADEFYRGEMLWLNENTPSLYVYDKKFSDAMLASEFRKEFGEKYGAQLLRMLEADAKTGDERIIPEQIEESNAGMEYAGIAASCRTVFRGEECNFYGLLKHMLSTDREERREAMEAWAALYESVSGQLEEQYAKLCTIRRREAEKLGFANYIDMIYLARHRFDYTAEDVARFREAIRTYVVPAAVKLHEKQRERLGVEHLEYYDENLFFKDGNSTPDKDTAGMIAAARQMYGELSPETKEFFDFMCEHELFDLETRPNKHLGGYCSSLPMYKAPFIFSNFNGTSADTEVLTHEAGHAFENYLASRRQPLDEYHFSTSEVNEIHSMAMEFFTEPWYRLFYGEKDAERYVYEHLADSFANLTYLVSVDEFQHRVFEGEQPDAAGCRAIWKKIEERFMPWRSYDGNAFLESGGFWMQKQHIFLYPFYYVDYALAMLCALQFYLRMRSDRSQAWQDYLALCEKGGSLGYFELLDSAGLKNPFDEETVREVSEGIMAVLEEMEKEL